MTNLDLFDGSNLFGLDDGPRPQTVRAQANRMVPSTTQPPEYGGSPFDSIRREDENGIGRWSARELMDLMGYSRWESFQVPLNRAMKAAANMSLDVTCLFRRSPEKSTGGRPGGDYDLDREAAYLTAMNGDPNKPEVAAAQVYFAVKTREAETAPRLPDLSDPLAALKHASEQWSKSVELALAERRRAEVAEASVQALLPAATAWETFCATGATLSVGAAAKYLLQRHGVNTGRNKLYGTLRSLDWVFKRTCEPKGEAVKAGLVEVEAGSKFTVEKTGEQRNGSPRTRLTANGLVRLADHFGVALDTDALIRFIAEEGMEGVA